MSTNYIAPIWRMPRNANNTPVDKLSNYSIQFGTPDYISAVVSELNSSTAFSISFWGKLDSVTSKLIIGDLITPYTHGVTAGWDPYLGGSFIFRCQNGTTAYLLASFPVDTDWHHFVVTYDAGTRFIYIDGAQAATDTTGPASMPATLGDTFKIGQDNSGGTNVTNGRISQCCVFDYALTDGTGGTTNQIEYLYNLNNPMAITGGEPIAYWPLGDNSNPNATAGYPNISVGADSVFDFNTTDHIKTNYYYDATTTPNLSLSFWCKSNVASNFIFPVSIKTGGGAYTNSIVMQYNRKLLISDGSWVFGTASISNNKWHHVFVTAYYDGSTTSLNMYVDGNTTPDISVSNLGSGTNAYLQGNLYLGNYNGASNGWPGEISNVAAWESNQFSNLSNIYNNGSPQTSYTTTPTVWYKLNQSANWEADTTGNWQIPDAVSTYPQSFSFDGINDKINLIKPGDWDDNQVHCVSLWIKNEDSNIGYIINSRGGGSATPGFSFIVNGTSTGYIFSNTVTSKIATGYQSDLKIPNDGKWHHVLWTHQPATHILKAYINGIYKYTLTGSAGTDSTSSIGPIIGNSGGAPWKGKISNIMAWEQIVLTDGNVAIGESAENQVAEVYNNGVPLTTAIASDNLKAWYKLDNTELFDGTNWSVENQKYPANWSSALNFDGSSYVSTSGNTGTDDVTFACWIKTTETYAYTLSQCAFGGRNNASGSNYTLGRLSSTFGTPDDTVVRVYNTTGSTKLNDGKWHHIVYTYDYTSKEVKAYVDGNSTPEATSTFAAWSTNQIIAIGWNGFDTAFKFTGNVSNCLYYNKVLTGSEINTLYNNGSPELLPSFSPTGWWKCDNITTGIQDSIGSNDGTNNGATKVNTFVSTEAGRSSGMTEQNLVNNNVSVFNGESVGMNSTNLVTSNISRTQPYSNYSFNFDRASSDYFDLGALNTALQPSDATLLSDGFSVSMWVNLRSVNTMGLWQNDGLGQTNYSGLLLQINSGGQINFGYSDNTGAGSGDRLNYVTTNSEISTLDTWYHIVAIYKGMGSVASPVAQGLYVNGIQVTAFNAPTGSASSLAYSASAKGAIGTVRNSVSHMDGKISNCACFDRILTQDEVLNIYNNGVPQNLQAASSFSNNIIAWWPMDEHSSYYDGTDWVIRDIENGNDGDGANTGNVDDLVGNAPGSEASGTGANLTIADLIGNMKDSKNNAYSINMADYADGVTNPANSGRSTDTP